MTLIQEQVVIQIISTNSPNLKSYPQLSLGLKKSAVYFDSQQLSSEINGKLCLSEAASISRCSFLLSLRTNEMNQNTQPLGIQLHGFEDSEPRSDDVKWNSFSRVARDMLIRWTVVGRCGQSIIAHGEPGMKHIYFSNLPSQYCL